jgi:hypothetical protein
MARRMNATSASRWNGTGPMSAVTPSSPAGPSRVDRSSPWRYKAPADTSLPFPAFKEVHDHAHPSLLFRSRILGSSRSGQSQSAWASGPTHSLYVQKLRGRKLVSPVFKRKDAQGNIDWVAHARSAELTVLANGRQIRVHMQQVVVNGENGSCGYCEERSFVFDLPKEFGRK